MKTGYGSSILLVIAAALCWAALGSWVVLLPASVHPFAFSGARGLVIATTFAWVSLRTVSLPMGLGGSYVPRDARWYTVLTAGTAYALSSITYVWSLSLIPVGVAAPLHYTTPVFLICGTVIVQRALPSWNNCLGAMFGIAGAFVLLSGASQSATLGMTVATASAGFWALYLGSQGSLSSYERSLSAVLAGLLMFLVSLPWCHVGLIALPILGTLLVAGVVSSGVPLVCLSRASKTLPPTTISLLLLCEPALAALLAYITTEQRIDLIKGVGLALITAGAASPLFGRIAR